MNILGRIWYEWSGQAEKDATHTEIERLQRTDRELRAELDRERHQLVVLRGGMSLIGAENKALRWKLDAREGRAEVKK